MILNTYESKNSRLVTGTKTKVETRIKKEKNKSSSSAIANLQTKTIHIRNAELFKITLSRFQRFFPTYYYYYYYQCYFYYLF